MCWEGRNREIPLGSLGNQSSLVGSLNAAERPFLTKTRLTLVRHMCTCMPVHTNQSFYHCYWFIINSCDQVKKSNYDFDFNLIKVRRQYWKNWHFLNVFAFGFYIITQIIFRCKFINKILLSPTLLSKLCSKWILADKTMSAPEF